MSSSTESTTSIDDLPPELIIELFRRLHPKHLAACSLVNKRWHSIYAAFKLHRLVALDFPLLVPTKWYHTDHEIEDHQVCTLQMFDRLAEQPIVSNLRYLALFENLNPFDPDQLNRFNKLMHLEIHLKCEKKLHLNLPRLQVLAIHLSNERCPLSVDCPQLSTLLYRGETPKMPEDANLLDVKQPETIRRLDTDMYGPKLAPFKNVECLITQEPRTINRDTLLSLPKLKELHFNLGSFQYSIPTFDDPCAFLRAKGAIKEFLGDARSLRASDFKFTFAGFELSPARLDEIDFNVQVHEEVPFFYWTYLEFYMKNIQLIDPAKPMGFPHCVDYARLMLYFNEQIPSVFQKFVGIEEVLGGYPGVEDADHFLWFLSSLRSLRSLRLDCAPLGQEFYDQLPAAAHLVEKLQLLYFDYELDLNFDFIGKLPRLCYLRVISLDSPFESVSSMVNSVGKSVRVELLLFLNECVIQRIDSMVWELTDFKSGSSESFENAKELLGYFGGMLEARELKRAARNVSKKRNLLWRTSKKKLYKRKARDF